MAQLMAAKNSRQQQVSNGLKYAFLHHGFSLRVVVVWPGLACPLPAGEEAEEVSVRQRRD